MSGWIDFKELRERLDFGKVLAHYRVELKGEGEQRMGFCPLPSHDGKRRSPSFSVNVEKKIFHCFGCQAKGNVLDFAALMEGKSPTNGRDLKQVAIDLRTRFCPELATKKGKGAPQSAVAEDSSQLEFLPTPRVVNAPLDFELRGLNPSHPYLAGRRFSKSTVERFGLGYCARGSLSGRIAIPLRDHEGRLIGYAGRVVDEEAISEENPKYRFPGPRERDGTVHEFKKGLFLYNGDHLKPTSHDLVVVEGFPSVWWLTQNGFGRVVGTMGAECSEEQARLILSLVTPDGRVVAMPDGDKAGEKFAQSLLPMIAPHRFVRWARLDDGRQPTDLSVPELKVCLTL